MIVGDRGKFALESEITHAYNGKSQMALGFFIIHIGGIEYGVRSPEASMLACSFHEVSERLLRRGTHSVPFELSCDALSIATSYLTGLYDEEPKQRDFLGMPAEKFTDALRAAAIGWAPDGDAAFDDGSHVLQFDLKERVRLIAFKNTEAREDMAETLAEQWLDASLFYDVLRRWKSLFEVEWRRRLL